MEHKIETLVAAPAAVEEALASLIVDNQDKYHALQYRALVTYVKRVYHPFLMCEPQVGNRSSRGTVRQQTLAAESVKSAQMASVFGIVFIPNDIAAADHLSCGMCWCR